MSLRNLGDYTKIIIFDYREVKIISIQWSFKPFQDDIVTFFSMSFSYKFILI